MDEQIRAELLTEALKYTSSKQDAELLIENTIHDVQQKLGTIPAFNSLVFCKAQMCLTYAAMQKTTDAPIEPVSMPVPTVEIKTAVADEKIHVINQTKLDQIEAQTSYDPEATTLWMPSADPDGTMKRVERPLDSNHSGRHDNEPEPRSVSHSMFNSMLVVIALAAFGYMIWASGLLDPLLH